MLGPKKICHKVRRLLNFNPDLQILVRIYPFPLHAVHYCGVLSPFPWIDTPHYNFENPVVPFILLGAGFLKLLTQNKSQSDCLRLSSNSADYFSFQQYISGLKSSIFLRLLSCVFLYLKIEFQFRKSSLHQQEHQEHGGGGGGHQGDHPVQNHPFSSVHPDLAAEGITRVEVGEEGLHFIRDQQPGSSFQIFHNNWHLIF